MPPISILRILFSLSSLLLIAGAIYVLIAWYDGSFVRDGNGAIVRVREESLLWIGLALTAWSLFGRYIVLHMIASPDTDETHATRFDGKMIKGANGGDLYVEAHGDIDAPVILLTHGWGLDSTAWAYAKRDLGERFRVIVWDLPGLGKSQLRGPFTLESAAADLKCVAALANGKPVVLAGHSIGGMIIQTLAREDPAFFARAVSRVVLLNTTYVNPLHTMVLEEIWPAIQKPVLEPIAHLTIWLWPLAYLNQWQSYLSGAAHIANRFQFGRRVTRSQLEHVTLLATRNSPAVVAKGALAMFHWRGLDAKTITKPTLIVGGASDIVTKIGASRMLSIMLNDTRLLEVADANHMGFLEERAQYNAAIADFAAEPAPLAAAVEHVERHSA